jgi:hypothetical protein
MAKTELGYIIKQDITRFLAKDTLDEMTGGKRSIGSTPAVDGDDYIWQELRTTPTEMVKGYLRHWYDVETEFRPIYEYDVAEAFEVGDRVAGSLDTNDIRPIYICILDAPAGTSLTNTTYYTATDDRNEVALQCAVTLNIYYLFTRNNPRQLPEQRIIDYDNTIKTLRDIQSGKITLDIAERSDVEADDPGQQWAYGDFDDVTQDSY